MSTPGVPTTLFLEHRVGKSVTDGGELMLIFDGTTHYGAVAPLPRWRQLAAQDHIYPIGETESKRQSTSSSPSPPPQTLVLVGKARTNEVT